MANPSSPKRKRGATRNIALAKKKKVNEKLEIEVSKESCRIIGKEAKHHITKAVCVARRYVSLQVSK